MGVGPVSGSPQGIPQLREADEVQTTPPPEAQQGAGDVAGEKAEKSEGWKFKAPRARPSAPPAAKAKPGEGAAPAAEPQLEALRASARELAKLPAGTERDEAQQRLLTKANQTWNGMSAAQRGTRTLADFRNELTAQVTGAAATPPATAQQQATVRAEKLFTAYRDQTQLALDAANAQGRFDLVDIVGDQFTGKHLNPADMADHVLRLNTSVHEVMDGVRSGKLQPQDFGKKDWKEVDGAAMYNLAMSRLKDGKVDSAAMQRMQSDPLWSKNPVMINEPGKEPLPLRRDNLSFWNRSPETLVAGNWNAGRAEQLGFMQKARDGAIGVADGRTTTGAAQFETAAQLAKGNGVAKNASQLLGSAVQMTGVPPADYKLTTETPEQLAKKVKSGEIDGFRTEGGYALTYKMRSPQDVAADVMKKLDAGELNNLPESTRKRLRETMGGNPPGKVLADELKSQDSAHKWREFGGTAAELVLVGVATGGLGSLAEGAAVGLNAGRLVVAATGTVVSSAAFTTTMALKEGAPASVGQYATDLALFGTLRAAGPFMKLGEALAPGSKAAQFVLRNAGQVAGADAVMSGFGVIGSTVQGQTADYKEAASQFFDNLKTNLPMVATLHSANGILAKTGLGPGDAIGARQRALVERFAGNNQELQGTLAKLNDVSSRAASADPATREKLAAEQLQLFKQFNTQVERLKQTNAAYQDFGNTYLKGDAQKQFLGALGPKSVEQVAATGSSAQLRAAVEPFRAQFNEALSDALKTAPAGEPLDVTVNRAVKGLETGPTRHVFTAAEQIQLLKMASEPGGPLGKNHVALNAALANASSGALQSLPGVPNSLLKMGDKFYGETADLASPAEIAKLPKTSAATDPAWWADHGPTHMRDTVQNVTRTVEDARASGLIPDRSPERMAFMKQAGQVDAVFHDMWMKDLSAKGRAEHPQRAAREAFRSDADQAVKDLAQGEFGRRLRDVYGVPPERVAEVTREVMAMSYAHSKSNVPLDVLNKPEALRSTMRNMISQDDPHGAGGVSAQVKNDPHLFEWLDPNSPAVKANSKLAQLGPDVVDMVRSLRLGDALRARGGNFHGSQGAPLGIVTENGKAKALMKLQDQKTGQSYNVEYESPPVVGESNTSYSGLAPEADNARGIKKGDLVLGIRGSEFNGAEKQVAGATGDVFYDIWKDYAGSFKDATKQSIVIEKPPGANGQAFAESVKRSLIDASHHDVESARARLEKEPQGSPTRAAAQKKLDTAKAFEEMLSKTQIRVVDAPPQTPEAAQAARNATAIARSHLDASKGPPTAEQLKALKPMMEKAGVDTAKLDMARAFQGAKVIDLKAGDVLAATGGDADCVYVATKPGVGVSQGRGYQAAPVAAGGTVGEVDVLGGTPRSTNIIATTDTQVIAIPKSVYQQQWVRSFYSTETILPRLKADHPEARSP